MSYRVLVTKRFEKDCALMEKRRKNLEKIHQIMKSLAEGISLPVRCRDHTLSGNYAGRRECHIEPDWLLIYAINETEDHITFERTGTHSDLFG